MRRALPRLALLALPAAFVLAGCGSDDDTLPSLNERPSYLGTITTTTYDGLTDDLLPAGLGEGAAVWALCHIAAMKSAASLARAGFAGDPGEAADALFDAILSSKSAVVFAVDEWDDVLGRLGTPNGRIQLAIPELFGELDALATEAPPMPTAEFPFLLSAGERRSFTANTIIRDPDWRRKDREGALAIHPDDAQAAGVADGGLARVATRRGEATVRVWVTDRMRPGHVSLPNGLGLDHAGDGGVPVTTGVAPNELTELDARDWFAGTPFHKYVPARVSAA